MPSLNTGTSGRLGKRSRSMRSPAGAAIRIGDEQDDRRHGACAVASSVNPICWITAKNRSNAAWPRSTTFGTARRQQELIEQRDLGPSVVDAGDRRVARQVSTSANSPGLTSKAATGRPSMRKKSASSRASNVLPTRGRGETTMKTGVRRCILGRSPSSISPPVPAGPGFFRVERPARRCR